MKAYILRVLVSADQFWNVVFGGNPDMTISCRAGIEQQRGSRWACVLCRLLDFFQPGHCDKSVASFIERTTQK